MYIVTATATLHVVTLCLYLKAGGDGAGRSLTRLGVNTPLKNPYAVACLITFALMLTVAAIQTRAPP
jgi:hypothetical protein